jgi:Protein of unknown function (DUF3455)
MRMQAARRLVSACLLLLGLAAGAVADDKSLPAAIAAPGETVVLTVHAVGLQLYECKPGADGKLGWTFTAPQATLTADGKVVGKHGAGPSWELLDGSAITAKAAANAPGATENDIPWLKLDVNSHKGSGQLDGVTTVQRINTKGGVLKGACDREKASEGMPYEADYVFLKKT